MAFPIWAIVVLCIVFGGLILLGLYRYWNSKSSKPLTEADQHENELQNGIRRTSLNSIENKSLNSVEEKTGKTASFGGNKFRKKRRKNK